MQQAQSTEQKVILKRRDAAIKRAHDVLVSGIKTERQATQYEIWLKAALKYWQQYIATLPLVKF